MTSPRPGCGLDPESGKPRAFGDPPHAPATVALDRHSAFVLCEACAALPRFRKQERFLLLNEPDEGAP